MHRIFHDLRFVLPGLLVLGLLLVQPLRASAQTFKAPSGLSAQVVTGLSFALDAGNVSYEPGLRVGGTVGVELDLDLPWRTTLTPQFTLAWNNWRFKNPLNEGEHSTLIAIVGVTYTQYRPFRIRDVSIWTSLDFGLGSSTVEFDGLLATNPMTESHSGLAFRFQIGTAYHLLPSLALGLYLDMTNVGLDELADLSFSTGSLDAGLVLRGQFPL